MSEWVTNVNKAQAAAGVGTDVSAADVQASPAPEQPVSTGTVKTSDRPERMLTLRTWIT